MRISNWVVQNARLIVFFVMVIVNPANADVRIIEWKSMVRGSAATDKSTKLIEIRGEISGKDVASLMGFLPSYPGPIVALDSRGGDVEAAIKIGQLLRKWSRQVVIRPNAVCISACVLVLAGAESRWVYGKVGIHRPYFTNDVAIEALAQKENYMRVEALIKTYLEEVNVRSVLYDDMLRISPSKVRFLSQEELESYGIGESDPYAEEARTVKRPESILSIREVFQPAAEFSAE